METDAEQAGEVAANSVFDVLLEVWLSVDQQVANLLLPSRLTQFAILISCFLIATVLARWIGPRFYDRMKSLEGWPKWRLRVLLTIHRRLRLLLFVVLAWSSTGVMAGVTPFTSRRYLLALAATIATAWFLVAIATRIVNNRFLRRTVTWGLWIYVTLFYLGQLDTTAQLLESIAIEVGEMRVSALGVVKALVVTAILFTAARIASRTSAARVQKNEDISPSMQVLMVKFLQVVLYGVAFFIGLKAIGADLTGLAVLSGAIGVGLGFGLQKVVSNLVSGIIILLDKSIKPGDVISLGETFGWIQSLGARYVSVVTRDGKEYLIPNEDLITGQVVNWSHTNAFVRLDIHFGTAYQDDPHLVRKIAIDAAKSVDRVLTTKPPVCHIIGFGDSSVDYTLRFWIEDPTGGLANIRGNVFLALWDAFKENGVSIPFPQREVRMLGDEDEDLRA